MDQATALARNAAIYDGNGQVGLSDWPVNTESRHVITKHTLCSPLTAGKEANVARRESGPVLSFLCTYEELRDSQSQNSVVVSSFLLGLIISHCA